VSLRVNDEADGFSPNECFFYYRTNLSVRRNKRACRSRSNVAAVLIRRAPPSPHPKKWSRRKQFVREFRSLFTRRPRNERTLVYAIYKYIVRRNLLYARYYAVYTVAARVRNRTWKRSNHRRRRFRTATTEIASRIFLFAYAYVYTHTEELTGRLKFGPPVRCTHNFLRVVGFLVTACLVI